MEDEVFRRWMGSRGRLGVKILNWNIRQGGGSRVVELAHAISQHEADVLVLTEHRNNSKGEDLKSRLLKQGFKYAESPESEPNENGVLIASKQPFYPSVFEEELGLTDYGDLSRRCILAGFPGIDIFGLYFPNTKDKSKLALYKFLFEKTPEFIDSDCLIAGDFNTGIHYLDEPKNSLLYSFQFQALETKYGWIDSWRSRNPKKKEFSWYSPGRGNGYRFDHLFGSPSLDKKVKEVYYSHEEREAGLSDHSPMIIDLDI